MAGARRVQNPDTATELPSCHLYLLCVCEESVAYGKQLVCVWETNRAVGPAPRCHRCCGAALGICNVQNYDITSRSCSEGALWK